MRLNKPSLPSTLAVGAAALCLVGAGTAGAVAGQLIGSDDIARHGVEKKNLAPGAVSWNRLAASVQEQIEASVSEGTPGPAGPAGAPGPQGPRGIPGEDGAGIVGWNVYETDGLTSEMTGYYDDLTLPEDGSYLVTVSGIVQGPGAIAVGVLDDQLAYTHACWSIAPVDPALSFAPCHTSYTFEGSQGEVLDVQLFSDFGPSMPTFPAMAEVSLVKIAGDVPRDFDPCGGMPVQQQKSLKKSLTATLGARGAALAC